MKAILVVDINDELLEYYEDFYVDYDLRAERKDDNVTESIRYVEDCPLKSIPQKKELEESGNSLIDDCKEYYTDGWNDCIDEILGEEDYEIF